MTAIVNGVSAIGGTIVHPVAWTIRQGCRWSLGIFQVTIGDWLIEPIYRHHKMRRQRGQEF